MTIATLPPGRTFQLACNGRAGVLLYLSPGAACVRYIHAEPKQVDLGNGRTFEAAWSGRPTTISLSTEVDA